MDEKAKKEMELWRELRTENMKNWRAWGSWFSWGSPVGLGILLVCVGVTLWLMAQAGLIGSR
ncbi:MAG TPA: hypothetical protein VLA88_01610 [Candidatus Saccharimonadales bacterium]|nr:hypothetical protein [Candidatus Saccharimonadales bacterium]